MSATSAVLAGRQAAEKLMLDACLIRREDPNSEVTDPETGVITPTYTTIYAGKCKIGQAAPISRPATIGEAFIWLQRMELHLPMSVSTVESDDLVRLTSSTLDPDLLSRTWRVRDLAHKTYLTARRHQIEEQTS
jgi:hypothetical protein